MQLVTPPMQQSGCPSQTSSVPKLLNAHSDSVVDSTQLSVCLTVLMSLSGSGRIVINPCPVHPYKQVIEFIVIVFVNA